MKAIYKPEFVEERLLSMQAQLEWQLAIEETIYKNTYNKSVRDVHAHITSLKLRAEDMQKAMLKEQERQVAAWEAYENQNWINRNVFKKNCPAPQMSITGVNDYVRNYITKECEKCFEDNELVGYIVSRFASKKEKDDLHLIHIDNFSLDYGVCAFFYFIDNRKQIRTNINNHLKHISYMLNQITENVEYLSLDDYEMKLIGET